MPDQTTNAVTGAYGYSGKIIAQRLLDNGHKVITLTNSSHRKNPFGTTIQAHPFNFDAPEKLTESLKGVSVLYNTYWVRFNHRLFKHNDAVNNTITLFDAAKKAGVRRVVHVSITNPSEDSPLEYFSGKAKLENALKDTGLSYAILRPAVFFGREDVLINNIAWALRRLPLFGVFGDGQYRMQPIHVDDFAELAVQQGAGQENVTINALGPETFSYRGLVEEIGRIIGKRRRVISVSPRIGFLIARLIGAITKDVLLTRDEIEGLMADLLYVNSSPVGKTKLTEWARAHASSLGKTYANELARRKNREKEYA